MVPFGFAQGRLGQHERCGLLDLSPYPFALSRVEGLRESFHAVCRSG